MKNRQIETLCPYRAIPLVRLGLAPGVARPVALERVVLRYRWLALLLPGKTVGQTDRSRVGSHAVATAH